MYVHTAHMACFHTHGYYDLHAKINFIQDVRSKLAALDEPDGPLPVVKSCSLDKPTQSLIKLIFDNDMFKEAMKSLEIGILLYTCVFLFFIDAIPIDTKKMPLGKLSKTQIAKGFEVPVILSCTRTLLHVWHMM